MTTLRDFATALTAGALGYTDGNGPVEVTSSGGDLDDSAYEVVYVLPSGRRVEVTLTWLPPEPFGPKYQAATANGTTGTECCVCGRRPNHPFPFALMARVVDGGTRFAQPHEPADEAGDMGYFPVGSSCARLFLRGYLTDLQGEPVD